MAQAITAPGDVLLVPSPTYPIHEFGFIISGAAIRHIPMVGGQIAARRDRPGDRVPARGGAGGEALDPQTAGRGAELSLQPDGHDRRRSISMWRWCSSPRSSTSSSSPTSPTPRSTSTTSPALRAAGAGRHRYHGRVHVAVQDLRHAGLAHGLCGRQRAADRGAGARQILPRLRRLHADPGGGGRRPQRPAGLRRRDPRHLQEPPGLPGRELRARRLGRAAAAGLDVRLGADPRGLSRGGLGGVLQAAGGEGRRGRLAGPGLRRVRRGLSCASRWSRTSTASARPRGTSRSSSPAPATACTTSSPWRRRRRDRIGAGSLSPPSACSPAWPCIRREHDLCRRPRSRSD